MPWALRQVFLPRFLHCHHCVNHGQFTGRFFTLMNDNTGHQKYSLLLSKKKRSGLSKRTKLLKELCLCVCSQIDTWRDKTFPYLLLGLWSPFLLHNFSLFARSAKVILFKYGTKRTKNHIDDYSVRSYRIFPFQSLGQFSFLSKYFEALSSQLSILMHIFSSVVRTARVYFDQG